MDSLVSTDGQAPLRNPVFRLLWLAWLTANITMWMNETASAWLMTSLTDNALMVALVQTAATLPVFLLGLPGGALADILDRRRYFAFTQLWVSLVALALCVLSFTQMLTAPLLLGLAFANGVATAMRSPVFAAIIPSVVERGSLPSALALNSVAVNTSRIVGPLLAGILLASAGSQYVYLINVIMSLLAFALILRWRSRPRSSALPGERFFAAMRVGVQHVVQSPPMRIVVGQTFLFFLQTSSLTALLPLIALQLNDGGPASFTALLSAMGAGAMLCALLLPRLRTWLGKERLFYICPFLHAAAACAVVWAPSLSWALPAMVMAGMAWIATANSLTLAAQLALPDWVRARGMSIFHIGAMGGMAAGAVLWGLIANRFSIPVAIIGGALLGPLALLATRRLRSRAQEDADLSPAEGLAHMLPSGAEIHPEEGPVMVTIEYFIDPRRAEEFRRTMQETRRARLRQGVLSWGLYRDASQPGRFVEYFLDENWIEHRRRMERLTAADVRLRDWRQAFHIGSEPPRIRRYVS